MKTRKEYDSIGGINVPNDRYWGASTQRSKKFFNIGKILVPPSIIRSIAIIKRSAAIVHQKDKLISAKIARAIIKASNEVINGKMINIGAHLLKDQKNFLISAKYMCQNQL